ncbi:MAG: DUF3179 domain-containing protein [Spirochaetaceae bacterium]
MIRAVSTIALALFAVTLTAPLDIGAGGAQEPASGDSAGNGPGGLSRELAPEFQNQEPPGGAEREFSTDFSRATISFDEVLSGGPAKDGIPAIDNPRFVPVSEADDWLGPQESVLLFSADNESRIYPIQILMWHEIVNDTVGGLPVAVTYCPLCNTGVAFGRRHEGRLLDFGVSGRLRFSNMLMYDRQTESWWQQATGAGVVGEFAGQRLEILPLLLLSWEDAVARYPEAQVLSRETGYSRDYGRNPYLRYDTAEQPFLYRGPEVDDAFDPMARVIMVEVGGEQRAFPYPALEERGFDQAVVGGEPVVVLWDAEVASPLDHTLVAEGRAVGTANAFRAEAGNRSLTFEARGGRIVDTGTESVWSANGVAVDGPLEGTALSPVPTVQHFWFSWTAFDPE